MLLFLVFIHVSFLFIVHLGGGLWGVICVNILREGNGLVFADDTSTAALVMFFCTLFVGISKTTEENGLKLYTLI
jgi:hypothetical protein